MPVARFQMPDGRIARFQVPDGTTPEQAQSMISRYVTNNPDMGKPSMDPTEGMSTFDKVAAGAGKAIYDIGRGAGEILGIVSPEEVAATRKLDAPLMNTTAGTVGDVAGNIAAAAPAMFIPGANTVVGAGLIGGALGALQPTAEGESRLENTAISGALGAAGQYAGNKLASWVGKKIAERQAAQVANSTRDTTLMNSKAAGYVVPPTQANPSFANKSLEGLAGKITTAQQASAKNQAVTDNLVRSALGVSDNTPITPETLAGIRTQAGQAYEAVKSIGQISTDQPYKNDLNAIKARFQGAAKDFPQLAKNDVVDLVESIDVPKFGADSAVDATAILRDQASKAYASGDKMLGKAYRQASDALEGLLERNVAKTGNADLLNNFRSARQLIAKTYSVENALNGSTGKVSAGKLAAQLSKGKPLSGELKKIAAFAQAFPKAAQDVQKMGSLPGISPLDYGLGLLTGTAGAAAGHPGAAALAFSRPAVRYGILSAPYQSLMTNPNYSTGLLSAYKQAFESTPYAAIFPGVYWGQK